MSTRRVGYDGRTPRVVDEGPASASAIGQIAALERVSVLELRGSGLPMGGASTIERRQATDAEMDAARSRETARKVPKPAPVTTDATSTAVSRQRGGAVTSAIHAARRAAQAIEEEPAVSEERADDAETIPVADEPSPTSPDPTDWFSDLERAAGYARDAWIERRKASEAYGSADSHWIECRRVLGETMASVASFAEVDVVPWSSLPSFATIRREIEAAYAGPFTTGEGTARDLAAAEAPDVDETAPAAAGMDPDLKLPTDPETDPAVVESQAEEAWADQAAETASEPAATAWGGSGAHAARAARPRRDDPPRRRPEGRGEGAGPHRGDQCRARPRADREEGRPAGRADSPAAGAVLEVRDGGLSR